MMPATRLVNYTLNTSASTTNTSRNRIMPELAKRQRPTSLLTSYTAMRPRRICQSDILVKCIACLLVAMCPRIGFSWTFGSGRFQWLSNCNLHGSYHFQTRSCICEDGWGSDNDVSLVKSPRCDIRICPAGPSIASIPTATNKAHAMAECSDAGMCDRDTGECQCFDGFAGRACERFSCPDDCNGNGKCVNIGQMAKFDTAFPLTASSSADYGDIDTIETSTWDQNRTFGCICDSYKWNVGLDDGEHQLAEYFGPGCSLRRCPSGDDPMTDADETDCNGKSQNGASTTAPTGAAGNLCHIECSNRGICNHKDGLCECFPGYYGDACQSMSSLVAGAD